MKFYKSFLFLFSIDSLVLVWVWYFIGLKFLILGCILLLTFNLFLFFFGSFYFKKNSFSFFSPDDPYGVQKNLEELKKDFSIKNIQLVKIKSSKSSLVFCFYKNSTNFIALSETFVESFSKQEIKILMSYVFKMAQTGDVFFVTLLSGFLFTVDKIFYIISYPLHFFLKKPKQKKERIILILFFKFFSLITKRIYTNIDKSFAKEQKEDLAFLLWKLDGFITVHAPQIDIFLATLFMTNPLTASNWSSYLSLQPQIKKRIQSLGVIYPP